ncbi:hypothetical protein SLEP1_g38809 [Rubroshorea leprosula]|uniref:Uncharacterized protein n=1 Tax=Rubroshorea leprosula TaxID=152421 RepID=A0AAV5KZ02_9ROSI|nr:hypothetical protein SLEP1_g38809 [Rubroshorea leprosula]
MTRICCVVLFSDYKVVALRWVFFVKWIIFDYEIVHFMCLKKDNEPIGSITGNHYYSKQCSQKGDTVLI